MPSFDAGQTGTTPGVTILNTDGTTHTAHTTAGFTEPVTGSHIYRFAHPAPGTLLEFIFDALIGGVIYYASVWDDGITTMSARAGDAMTLTAAYDHTKDDVLTPLAEKASQASVDAIAADYAKAGEAATAVAGLATEANATANKNAVIAAMPDIPPPDVGTTITPATLDTDGHALGRVMPYGVVTAYVGTTAHYQFTADADGDFSYVLPDGSTWTLKARRAGYQTMTAEVAT